VWNTCKKKYDKPQSKFDKLEIKLHIANVKDDKPLSAWQLLASPFLAVTYAVPGFLIAIGLVWLVRHNSDSFTGLNSWMHNTVQTYTPGPTASLGSKIGGMVTSNWPKKLMGYGAALFWGRRPVKGVFDDVQLWFAEWLYKHDTFVDRAVFKILPPPFKARYNRVRENGVQTNQTHSARLAWILGPIAIIAFGFMVYGGYVMFFKAGA
jgi:hypothetical protein